MRNKILEDLVSAMKSQDKETLAVLRMVKGAMQLEEINVKHELNDDEMISVLSKQIKTRKESIEEFKKGKRQDLIDKTQSEIDILSKYMPAQLSEQEVEKIIDDAFSKVNPTGPSDLGKIMGIVSPLLKGKADMSNVSKIIKEKLNK